MISSGRKCAMMAGLAALALISCAPQTGDARQSAPATATATATVHPISGLKVIPLTVTTEGKVYRFRVELASTGAEQARGLMYRETMGPDEGMIFPFVPARPAAFWMKNTVLPLDIIFIGSDGKVTNIAANAVPYSLDPLPSDGPVKGVLELVAGRAAVLGIAPGSRVEW